jgi:hypothetical protein
MNQTSDTLDWDDLISHLPTPDEFWASFSINTAAPSNIFPAVQEPICPTSKAASTTSQETTLWSQLTSHLVSPADFWAQNPDLLHDGSTGSGGPSKDVPLTEPEGLEVTSGISPLVEASHAEIALVPEPVESLVMEFSDLALHSQNKSLSSVKYTIQY